MDGWDCNTINERDGKLMLVLHTSPVHFMLISDPFLAEMKSITVCRVEIARDVEGLRMWEWFRDTGPTQRINTEILTTPSNTTSILVQLSIKLAYCSKDCKDWLEESIRYWQQSLRDEDASSFLLVSH
ncbi:hypothetical protein PENTCL1PPCAC_21400 [Pristionchus entomophagus]|uniref:Uncharacterized protein n=1 Tax=Pristionchus entomophagus TaxID=358040 RepID=A0AAV5TY95_9BILA|nr:hypothetical protein PENTCL1PPCAC_21400 [Pristionchus entomophagus]